MINRIPYYNTKTRQNDCLVRFSLNYRTDQLLICCSPRHAKSALLLSHWSRAVANYKQACDWLVAFAQNRTGSAVSAPMRTT